MKRGRRAGGDADVDRNVEGDDAVGEHEHPVGEQDRLVDVVGHEQDRRAVPLAQARWSRRVHPDAGEGVERAERLVEQQQVGLAHQGPGQRRPLGLATGQRLRPVVARGRRGRPRRARPGRGPRLAAVQPERDVVEHPRPRQQPRILEDDRAARRDADVAAGARRRGRRGSAAACSCPSRCGRAGRRTRPGAISRSMPLEHDPAAEAATSGPGRRQRCPPGSVPWRATVGRVGSRHRSGLPAQRPLRARGQRVGEQPEHGVDDEATTITSVWKNVRAWTIR